MCMFGSLRSSPLRLSTTTQFITPSAIPFYKTRSLAFYSTAASMSNVYFDISANSQPLGRVVLYVIFPHHFTVWVKTNLLLANCMMMLFPRQQRTFVNCAPDKTDTYDTFQNLRLIVGLRRQYLPPCHSGLHAPGRRFHSSQVPISHTYIHLIL